MDRWMTLLQAQLATKSKAQIARELGVSRPAVSLLADGKYPGDTARMAARVIEAYDRIFCPYVRQEISLKQCADQSGAMPMSSPGALRWWRACQDCEHKPINAE